MSALVGPSSISLGVAPEHGFRSSTQGFQPAPYPVGIVTTSFWPIIGGTARYAWEVASGLINAGCAARVVARFVKASPGKDYLIASEPARRYFEHFLPVEIVSLNRTGELLARAARRMHYHRWAEPAAIGAFHLAFGSQMRAALAGCRVIHYSGVGRELIGFCAERVARRLKAAFVVTPHLHRGTWGDSPLDFRLYRRADALLAHTEVERSHLVERGVRSDRVHVIGNPVGEQSVGDGERFRRRHAVKGPMVLFVGRKAAYKGRPLLLAAADHVRRSIPDATFVFIGPADDGSSVSSSQIEGVLDLPPVSEQQKADALAACDVFCLPSSAESFGIGYIEAWRQRKPVVGLDIPTVRELICGAGGGHVADARPEALAASLSQLLTDPRERAALGEHGHAASLAYLPNRVIDRICDAYAQATAERSRD